MWQERDVTVHFYQKFSNFCLLFPVTKLQAFSLSSPLCLLLLLSQAPQARPSDTWEPLPPLVFVAWCRYWIMLISSRAARFFIAHLCFIIHIKLCFVIVICQFFDKDGLFCTHDICCHLSILHFCYSYMKYGCRRRNLSVDLTIYTEPIKIPLLPFVSLIHARILYHWPGSL